MKDKIVFLKNSKISSCYNDYLKTYALNHCQYSVKVLKNSALTGVKFKQVEFND